MEMHYMNSIAEEDFNVAFEDSPYHANPSLYFEKLKNLSDSADKIREQDEAQEKTLVEYLPVNEKFSFNKEGTVLAKWQERQRDWQRIQANINKRIGAKKNHPLMMTTSDEYRAKAEEYDLIQAAIPTKDRYSERYWEMSLRGGGPLRVTVGHIFSGIECDLDGSRRPPKLVRKPKAIESSTLNNSDAFLNRSVALTKKRKKYEKTILEYRPHEVTYNDASHLLLKSQSLFKWARDSSAQFFDQIKSEEEENKSLADADAESLAQSEAHSVSLFDLNVPGPKVELLSEGEVIFNTQPNKPCTKVVQLRNFGTAAVTFHWGRSTLGTKTEPEEEEPNGLEAETASQGSEVGFKTEQSVSEKWKKVLKEKGLDEGKLRRYCLSKKRENFFCAVNKGIIYPGETITTTFSFCSAAGEGSFRESWVLHFSPEETAVYATRFSKHKPKCELSDAMTFMGMVNLTFRGICTSQDETVSKRLTLSQDLEKKCVDAFARDIVLDCLRNVRTPVRIPELQERQMKLFREVNKEILEGLSLKFGSTLPVFLEPGRLNNFYELSKEAERFFEKMESDVLGLKEEMREIEIDFLESFGQKPVVLENNPFLITDNKQQELREILFPENVLEIFDEVSEADVTPAWNFDLKNILVGLDYLKNVTVEIEAREKYLTQDRVLKEKEAKKAAKRAANDSDDDDDEEEEEEEDENAENEKPLHPSHIELKNLLEKTQNFFHLLLPRTIPYSDIENATKLSLDTVFDSFPQFWADALNSAQLTDMVENHHAAIPALANPFLTEEGREQWEYALKQTSFEVEPEVPAKGKKKPPAKKNAPPPTEPTAQQVSFFHRELYESIKNCLLDVMEEVYSHVDEKMFNLGQGLLEECGLSGDKLFDVAVVRKEGERGLDMESAEGNKDFIGFINFNGDAFIGEKMVFSVFGGNKERKKEVLKPVLDLVLKGAKSIVLLYEGKGLGVGNNFTESDSILSFLPEIQDLLAEMMGDYKNENDLLLEKQKKPSEDFKSIDFLTCQNFAELNFKLKNLFKTPSENSLNSNNLGSISADSAFIEGNSEEYFSSNIPIFLLENISTVGVVPVEPEFKEEESDDESAPIPIGSEEVQNRKKAQFDAKRPHRVSVSIHFKTANSGDSVSSPGKKSKKSVKVDCFADGAAAINELVEICKSSNQEIVFLEANPRTLYQSSSSFQKLQKYSKFHRYVSQEIRETFVWTGLIQLLSKQQKTREISNFIYETAETISALYAQNEEEMKNNEGNGDINVIKAGLRDLGFNQVSPAHAFISGLFPFSLQEQINKLEGVNSEERVKPPTTTFVLGGKIRSEKFRVLDQMIDLMDTIILVGEMSIPFLTQTERYEFPRHKSLKTTYNALCKTLIGKARMRGCQLIFPIDVNVGDEEIAKELKEKCFTTFEVDARNEGVDYEGELKTYMLEEEEESDFSGLKVIDGFIYDIGVKTCDLLKDKLNSSDLIFIWGTAGVCEVAGFQLGQQTLVVNSSQPLPDEGFLKKPDPLKIWDKNPQNTIVIGDSNVEWFKRVLDPDGELSNGNLVNKGAVKFLTKDSSVFIGLVGLLPSETVSKGLNWRAAELSEFSYAKLDFEEEEVDSEDEEDDEDDDN